MGLLDASELQTLSTDKPIDFMGSIDPNLRGSERKA